MPFQQATLIFVMSRFFIVVEGWFSSVGICVYGNLLDGVFCNSSGVSKPFSCNSFSRCDNLFIRAILQRGLVYCYIQVWWHFGKYELFDDGMCVFGQLLKFIKKIYLLLICWIEDNVLEIVFRCRPRLWFYVLPTENC